MAELLFYILLQEMFFSYQNYVKLWGMYKLCKGKIRQTGYHHETTRFFFTEDADRLDWRTDMLRIMGKCVPLYQTRL